MIDRIEIKAFKSLLDVSVELGRVNVFVGANGAGKSNLLEAIGVLGAAAAGRVDDEALLRRGVRPGVPALYKSSFKGSRLRSSIGLAVTANTGSGSEASYRVELDNPIHDPQPAWSYRTEKLSVGGEKIAGRSPATMAPLDPKRGLAALKAVELSPESPGARLLQRLSSYAIYAPNTMTLRGLVADPQQREPVGLSGGRLPEAVLKLLRRRFFDPRIRRIATSLHDLIDWADSYGSRRVGQDLPLSPSVSSTQRVLYFRDRFMADKRNGLTGYDASEGALYVLFAAVLAASPSSPPMFAIDNMDHGLNPRLARALVGHFCNWVLSAPDERQVLLTSHNPLVLDGLPLDNDDVRLFAVGRSRKGRTTVTRIRVDLSDLQRDGEIWTVSRLWVAGHLGGVPDV